jgi:hypothetical protein
MAIRQVLQRQLLNFSAIYFRSSSLIVIVAQWQFLISSAWHWKVLPQRWHFSLFVLLANGSITNGEYSRCLNSYHSVFENICEIFSL